MSANPQKANANYQIFPTEQNTSKWLLVISWNFILPANDFFSVHTQFEAFNYCDRDFDMRAWKEEFT